MRGSIAAVILAIVVLGSASADEGLTEEELVAPLVMKQNCWGGIIRFVLANERFEVDDSLCADGSSITWSSTLVCGWSKRGGCANR
jgi:hypothetical protein